MSLANSASLFTATIASTFIVEVLTVVGVDGIGIDRMASSMVASLGVIIVALTEDALKYMTCG